MNKTQSHLPATLIEGKRDRYRVAFKTSNDTLGSQEVDECAPTLRRRSPGATSFFVYEHYGRWCLEGSVMDPRKRQRPATEVVAPFQR